MNPKLDLNLNAAVIIGGLVEIGVLLELVLLSIGVGYRMLLLRKEANELQKRNLDFQANAREALEQEVETQTQELRSTLQTLESTQKELVQQARLATVGNLVTGLAHEIGNPLNLTIGGAQELEDIIAESAGAETETNPKVMNKIKSCAGLITRGSERIEVIVRNLNQLAQTGNTPQRSSCEIKSTLQATLELMGHRLSRENIEIETSNIQVPRVRANSSELSQVILNLMLNACDALPHGGIIKISGQQKGNQVHLDFIDSGPGVPTEIKATIFDAFYTTKENGTGLGLAISHQMVHDWGGHLTLEESESGAHFRLKLQIQADDS
jgi:two-component system NtrC family sensor kinase